MPAPPRSWLCRHCGRLIASVFAAALVAGGLALVLAVRRAQDDASRLNGL